MLHSIIRSCIQLGGNIVALTTAFGKFINAALGYYYEIMTNGFMTNIMRYSVCNLIFHDWKPRLKEWMLN